MKVRYVVLLAIAFTTALDSAARAEDWLCEFFHSFPVEFKRRNCWPEPFTCPDKQAVRAPFVGMIANGWERQNLLADPYFENINGPQLTEAARLKIRWVVFECPKQHRIIFVHRADSTEETAARVNAVRDYAAQIAGPDVPAVLESNMSGQGWPAERVDIVSRKFISSLPAPKLPSNSAGGSSSGGDQGSGGGN